MKRAPIYSLCLVIIMGLLTGAQAQAATFTVIGALARDHQSSPGEELQGRILVKNTGDEPVEVQAELFDYSFQADGSNHYGKPGSVARSNAHWISISPRQMVIPPHETLAFYYNIAVPNDQALTGSYWSMVMLTPVKQPYEANKQRGKVVVGIQPILRYGIQLNASISGTGFRAMTVENKALKSHEGNHQLDLALKNSGSLWFRPKIWAELYNERGQSIGRFDGNEKRLYPGCSGAFSINFGQLESGTYNALVVADLGGEDIMGSQYTLEIP